MVRESVSKVRRIEWIIQIIHLLPSFKIRYVQQCKHYLVCNYLSPSLSQSPKPLSPTADKEKPQSPAVVQDMFASMTPESQGPSVAGDIFASMTPEPQTSSATEDIFASMTPEPQMASSNHLLGKVDNVETSNSNGNELNDPFAENNDEGGEKLNDPFADNEEKIENGELNDPFADNKKEKEDELNDPFADNNEGDGIVSAENELNDPFADNKKENGMITRKRKKMNWMIHLLMTTKVME